jgi:hypothetical protein
MEMFVTEANRTVRGTVIKVPGNEPGLILAEGRQYAFQLEAIWVSPVAPAPNQVVEVALDASDKVVRVNVVDAQQLAREKLNQFTGVAGEHGQQAAELAKAKFAAQAGRMGYPMLIAAVLLWVAWFLLPSLQVQAFVSRSFSFSELIGLSIGQGDVTSHFGFWSFLGLLSILAPWIAPWLRQAWSPLLNVAPLAFVLVTFARVKWQIHSAASSALDQVGGLGGAQARAMAEQMMSNIAEQISKAISTGVGLWLVVLASVALTALGIQRYRARSAVATA